MYIDFKEALDIELKDLQKPDKKGINPLLFS